MTKARKTDDTARQLAQGSRPAGRKGGPGGLKERPIRIVAYITEALSDWLEAERVRRRVWHEETRLLRKPTLTETLNEILEEAKSRSEEDQ